MKVEEKHIKRCIELAKKGEGYVSPNPLVGAVIVKSGKVLGEGFHKKYGDTHAEVNAFENSAGDVRGATLYSNLEPCCHSNKQTPPCVPLIISKGIKKVVISNLDSNPSVNAKGIQQLQDAGVEVITGIIEDEANELNKFYFKFVSKKLPYITIKIAQSADGFMSKTKNEQTWFTGKEAAMFVHRQRAKYDAVLVGANTVSVDDPLLTVREVKGRNPKRLIIDGSLSIPLDSKLVAGDDPEKTWVFTSLNSDDKKIIALLNVGVKVFQLKSENNKIKLIDILKKLAHEMITSLFVEGGANVFHQFITENLFDELILLQSPIKLGSGVPGFDFETAGDLKIIQKEKIGIDEKIILKKKIDHFFTGI